MAPSMHPQAKFDPIPPNLDLHNLVDRTPNFEWAMRISAKELMRFDAQRFEKLVYLHVIAGGKPLVITDWNLKLPKSIFSAAFLQNTYDKKEENVRDINAQSDIPMTTGHYLRSMKQLTDQWTPSNFRDERRQRLYLKDIDCPPEWHDYLRKVIPPVLFYMNENVDDKGVPRNEARDEGMFVDEQANAPAAPAGDLMSSLPEDMRAQNLMCYIGHEGTYTPAHREMCASLGQNIMVDASGDEKGEKPGSSIWFMTETKDREVVREYFLSMLGHDIEIEKHFAQVNAWKKATFPVYIVEQKVGDFILVPPLAPHQVWNRGTRTMKVAWNRTTVETLELALHEALPKARLVCRDEQYKNKAIIYFTLRKYYAQLNEMEEAEMSWLNFGQDLIRSSTSSRKDQMAKDFKKLLSLFTEILVDEMFGQKEKDVEMIPFDSFVTCSYCRANIFNRFLTCKHCVRQLVNGDEDTYDVCMECYAMGRSCLCISKLSWCEQWDWSELVNNYAAWCEMVIRNDQVFDVETSPLPLEVARRKAGKKSLAQICQEQLRRRPFRDISKPEEPSDLEPSDPELDDNNRPKKKSRRKKKKGDVYRCHVCSHKDYTHRLAFCSNQGCREAYCFGTLYRGFDLMPQDVLQDEKWQCPKCRKICNCGGCRRLGNTTPYQPKNTFIGHDTRSVADDRSVESLVDFRLHNLNWLKAAGDEPRNHNSKRMERLRQQADAEKAKDGASRDAVGPALADGVAATMDHTMPESMPEGFDDLQNAVRAENVPADYSIGDPSAHQQNENGGPAEVADMMTAISQDPSSYPDPSMYPDPLMMGGERRLGMGYYEHDDTPDKILFDPYQMPSADVIALDDEPSEFVKKTLRAAKRRARLDDDNDPDFLAPKSHKKRPRLEKDMLVDPAMTLDPAFLTQDNTMTEAQANGSTEPEPEPANVEEDEPEEEDREDSADQYKPYEPNVPALRHSKPKVSYADFEHDVEEFNDVVPVKNTADTGDNDAPSQVTDPLDAAANAIRALTGTDTPQETTPAPTRVAASSSTGRRPSIAKAAWETTKKVIRHHYSYRQASYGIH
ncbi:hypothetical protein UCRPA7_4078 [Phaeoacremonium minimum UCRPA7]|uniref:JmjC domain-containing protein n=1 Tax=Phaeoacremonium minimum (strain UCR-PA7) TaxID=1286976 RepID=R8BMD5_PHAM7|nr:hypothetical protein UCRPA7_4078 [Phaeoacremonium minimum UCRPA7]EOO00420.1 hypothetical protein UCRPA7_4078 [Phaeoacremonium minimum UCRPA7]